MTSNITKICRKCSCILAFMLLLQLSYAQYNFTNAQKWMEENSTELGGRAYLVIFKEGKIIYTHAVNELTRKQKIIGKFLAKKQGRDKDDAIKDFDGNTKERIASCSKWLSAALFMTFVDEGKLKLEDTIGKFLPIFTQNGKGGITISQCLSHLTAIKPGSLKEDLQAFKNFTSIDEAMQALAIQPMEGTPGRVFHYSNAGLQIAGAVIEKLSGKNFETLFAERIAKPLNMKNTDFGNGKVAMPAGGAFSTPEDYIHFLQMILQEGMYNGQQILTKNAIMEMQKNRKVKDVEVRYSPAEAGTWGYGFGEWVMAESTEEKSSDAVTSPGLFGSFPWVNYKENYAAFLFTFNIKSKGRNERYKTLKQIVDDAILANNSK
jgi:CubicO group peptidase (beta-lactamase class C family)